VLTFAAVLAFVLLAGATRLALAPKAARTVRVATVTLPAGLFGPGEMFRIADGRVAADTVEGKLTRLHEWFFAHTEREAAAGARLVAWPEMSFLVAARDEPAALERAKRLAAARGIYLSMGIGTLAEPGRPFENKAVLVDPSGNVAYSYLKSRPVMGWEASVMRRGDGRLPLADTALGRVTTAICFDNDAPELVRQAGSSRADFWILPANDWPQIRSVHFHMAAFRAIENGTPILRAAAGGISGAFDPWGRAVAATDHLSGAPTMVAELPVGGVPTLYVRIGDAFAWACVAGCLAMACLVLARRPRAAAESVGPVPVAG
jgi:apolipoprotein N-acyltransferase